MIIRLSPLNGKLYVASNLLCDVYKYAISNNVPVKWIRYRRKTNKYYLRLWGRYLKLFKKEKL